MKLQMSVGSGFAVLLVACAGTAAKPAADAAAPVGVTAAASLDQCVNAVLATKPGKFVKLEGKTEGGVLVYEFDVRGSDGKDYDIECEAATGKIIEVETELKDAMAPEFAAKMKVTQAEAEKVALAAHPGTIIEVEYEMEPNGDASYEFDVLGADGKETKVEVDATSGKIVEANVEHFQIGME